jgi:ferredoxin
VVGDPRCLPCRWHRCSSQVRSRSDSSNRSLRAEYEEITFVRVVIDWGLCEGNGVCAEVAPEIFVMTEDDELLVVNEDPPATSRGKLESAMRACPKHAIAVED